MAKKEHKSLNSLKELEVQRENQNMQRKAAF